MSHLEYKPGLEFYVPEWVAPWVWAHNQSAWCLLDELESAQIYYGLAQSSGDYTKFYWCIESANYCKVKP